MAGAMIWKRKACYRRIKLQIIEAVIKLKLQYALYIFIIVNTALLTHGVDIAILSVCLSVTSRSELYRNGLRYHHSLLSSAYGRSVILVFPALNISAKFPRAYPYGGVE